MVTHIHLDHAGGVGDLAEAFPQAQVVVQERGARHLADPARLVASAHRVFGESMDRLFGDLRPTDPARIVAVGATGSVDLGGGRTLAAFHNPGHASHHIGLVDSLTGDLYTGDAAGVYVPETRDVRPATPPPDFDLNLTLSSLAAMRAVRPQRLLFSHFGPVTDIDEVLSASVDELHAWVDTVRAGHRDLAGPGSRRGDGPGTGPHPSRRAVRRPAICSPSRSNCPARQRTSRGSCGGWTCGRPRGRTETRPSPGTGRPVGR